MKRSVHHNNKRQKKEYPLSARQHKLKEVRDRQDAEGGSGGNLFSHDQVPLYHENALALHEDRPPLYIIMVAPEIAPAAKVGGLGDVSFGLSRELELRGNTLELIVPKYDCMQYEHIDGLRRVYDDLWVPWSSGAVHCSVWFGSVHGRSCYFIESHSPEQFFNRGCYYGCNDDVLRFAFFCKAALEFMFKAGKHPDIIHCHDWQTGLVPVLLYEIYAPLGMAHTRVCYTIHNFRHQGVTGDALLDTTGLGKPMHYKHPDRLGDFSRPDAINLMKGGIVYANFVTTVSNTYAFEAKDGDEGAGLQPVLQRYHMKYGGIVNGIDYEYWNPETDQYLVSRYSLNTIDLKKDNTQALRQRLLLEDGHKPIVAFVGRLDPQKGLDLVKHALFYCVNNGAQFVLLGSSPVDEINRYFWELKRAINDNPDSHLEIGYHEDLAHLIYGGADMIIVPSRFEPCGLTQLIAMRYGTIPVVRAVGGLADTVFDRDWSDRPVEERNGYVFTHADYSGIESALSRAIGLWYGYPEEFRTLMQQAMRCDYSWRTPAHHYENIYHYIRDK
ncbi:MAG: glycogen synthase [Desulfobacterota bacterium]|nr:glycogen synthase [Thermodesulfobacteriota bacterium]